MSSRTTKKEIQFILKNKNGLGPWTHLFAFLHLMLEHGAEYRRTSWKQENGRALTQKQIDLTLKQHSKYPLNRLHQNSNSYNCNNNSLLPAACVSLLCKIVYFLETSYGF